MSVRGLPAREFGGACRDLGGIAVSRAFLVVQRCVAVQGLLVTDAGKISRACAVLQQSVADCLLVVEVHVFPVPQNREDIEPGLQTLTLGNTREVISHSGDEGRGETLLRFGLLCFASVARVFRVLRLRVEIDIFGQGIEEVINPPSDQVCSVAQPPNCRCFLVFMSEQGSPPSLSRHIGYRCRVTPKLNAEFGPLQRDVELDQAVEADLAMVEPPQLVAQG